MKNVKWAALCMAVVLILSITGCSSKTDVSKFDENTLVIHKDGSLTEVSVDTFEAEYYSQEDLEKYVNEVVSDYNLSHPSDSDKKDAKSITVDKVSADEKSARVELTYEGVDDYTAFNGAQLALTAASDLSENAKALNFKDAKGQSLTFSSIEKAESYQALVVYTTINVSVTGKIAYVSDNVTITDNSTARCEGTLAVIIYK